MSAVPGRFFRNVCLGAALWLAVSSAAPALADAGRLAFVQDDGTLKIGTRIVRLYGIYIPPTERICRTFLQPVRCAPRAALELDRKIHGLVFCDRVGGHRDGSVSAVCRVRTDDPTYGPREDLAAFLLRQGWAVAVPGAPFAYHTFERIARVHRRGIWGFQADSVRVP
ncbi:MAG: thermonuclease family protein [Kiloniellaceae bacterium]